jgi:RHS repeat-associated protein
MIASQRWLRYAAGTLALLCVVPRAVNAQSSCPGSNVCSTYSGTVSLHPVPEICVQPNIHVSIYGPLQELFPTGTMLDGVSPSCEGGGFSYEAALGGWVGSYGFVSGYPGYRSSGVASGASCTQSGSGATFVGTCQGGAGIDLFAIDDEPVEFRQCPNVAAPVNVTTGNVWFDQTDVAIPGIGAGLRLVRSYNSVLASRNVVGTFGRGWTHSYEQSLTFPSATIIKMRSGDGAPVWFEDFNSDSTYNALVPRLETSWIVLSGSVYTRNFKQGGSEVYSSAGRLTTQTDAVGNTTTFTYDAGGRLQTVTEPSTRSLTFAYDSLGKVVSVTGPAGVIASYAYDATSRLDSVSYPDGSGYSFTYDSAARVLSVVDASGRVVETHTYDSAGRGITSARADGQEKYTLYYMLQNTLVADANGNVTDYEWESVRGITPRVRRMTGSCASCAGATAGQTQSWTYDANGSVLTDTDALGNVTSYTYDASGNRLTETTPAGTTTYTYDSQDRVLTVAAPGGGLTTYTHGAAGPLTITEKVTSTQNRTTTLTYNTSHGKLETITDPRSKTTTLGYNSFGDLSSVTDPLTHATTFGYDALGRRTTVTDALSNTTTTEYDARGRVTRITDTDSKVTDFGYDLSGLRTTVADALGRTTTYNYDDYGRLRSVVDPLGSTTTYGYDGGSNLVTLTDAREKTTAFSYDTFNRASVVTYPGGAQETFTYDDAGRLSKRRDRKNVSTTYAYDTSGRLTTKSYSDGTPSVTYTYGSAGQLATAGNTTDTLTWTYDLAGQLLSEQSSKNSSTGAYTYDVAGNRLTLSLDGTLFSTNAYDDASRLSTITRGSNVFTFGYDNANRRTSLAHPNSVSTSYSYDDVSRLTNLTAALSGTTITQSVYTYDAVGNRLSKTHPDYGETYEYDPAYRLTRVARGTTNYWGYGYDAVGNRLTAQVDQAVTTATYNDLNQLASQAGGGPLRVRGHLNEPGTATVNAVPARVLPGNAFESTTSAATGTNTIAVVGTDVSSNATTQNYQVTVSGTAATYSYDSNGNLTQRVEGGVTWTYVWDAENRLKWVCNTTPCTEAASVGSFKYDALGRRVEKVAGGVTTSYTYSERDILREGTSTGTSLKYIHGPAFDEPLAHEDGAGALTYYHADGLGSIVKTTNSAGSVLTTRRYDAFGNLELGVSNGYSFTGREWDTETGLYYYRFRYYDAKTGRFITEDPLGFNADINFYRYAFNDPVNLIDPMGLDVQICTRQAKNMPSGVPHSVVFPTNRKPTTGPGTGPCMASGFGPAKGIGWQGGAIHDEPICDEYGNQSPAFTCSTVSTSDCVEKCVERKIAQSKKNPPPYRPGPRFLGGFQCTDWSDQIVADCQKECANE